MSFKSTQTTCHTKAAPHTEPPITMILCHQLPPKPQHPQQNVDNVLPTPNRTQQNVPSPGIKSIQPTLPYSDFATETISTPHSLSPCSLLQRLLNELAITMTLIDRLSDLLSIDATSHSSSTLKNLFDLITELPQIIPLSGLVSIVLSFRSIHNSTSFWQSVHLFIWVAKLIKI